MAASLYASSFFRGGRRSVRKCRNDSRAVPSSQGEVMIETQRLRLRRLRPDDEADLVALDSDPDVMRYVGSPAGVKSAEETLERALFTPADRRRSRADRL